MSLYNYYKSKKQIYEKVPIFISSTFEDMNGEREEIIKMGKKLHSWGLDYGLDIFMVDFRTGISVEASCAGKTVSLCLEAISNCRPFVIALIGSRKGWIPTIDDLPDSLKNLINYGRVFPNENDRYSEMNYLLERDWGKEKRKFESTPFSLESYSEALRESIILLRENIGKRSITELEMMLATQNSRGVIGLVRDEGKDKSEISEIGQKLLKDGAIMYKSETNHAGDIEYNIIDDPAISISDYLFEGLKKRCEQQYPDQFNYDFFSNEITKRQFTILQEECGIYSHADMENQVEDIFINTEWNVFKFPTGYCGVDRLAIFVNTLIEKYANPVIFSLEPNLTWEMFELQANELEPYIEEGEDASSVFIVASHISLDTKNRIVDRLGKRAIFVIGIPTMDAFELAVEKYSMTEVFSAIEASFAKRYKCLRRDQLDRLSQLEELGVPYNLTTAICEMNAIHNYLELDDYIDHICSNVKTDSEIIREQETETRYGQFGEYDGSRIFELKHSFIKAARDKQWEDAVKSGRPLIDLLEQSLHKNVLSEIGIDVLQHLQANYVICMAECLTMDAESFLVAVDATDNNISDELEDEIDHLLIKASFQPVNPYLEYVLSRNLCLKEYTRVSLLDYYASMPGEDRIRYIRCALAGIKTIEGESKKVAVEYKYYIGEDNNNEPYITAKVKHVKVRRNDQYYAYGPTTTWFYLPWTLDSWWEW